MVSQHPSGAQGKVSQFRFPLGQARQIPLAQRVGAQGFMTDATSDALENGATAEGELFFGMLLPDPLRNGYIHTPSQVVTEHG